MLSLYKESCLMTSMWGVKAPQDFSYSQYDSVAELYYEGTWWLWSDRII